MEKPVLWMALRELRDELEQTRPAWEAVDLDGVLSRWSTPCGEPGRTPHQGVVDDLLRRPCLDDAP